MHNTNGKLVRAVTKSSINQNVPQEFGKNIILIRSSRTVESGQILLRTTEPSKNQKTNLVLDDGMKQRHIFIQQNDFAEGVLVQSVKRLTSPILLLGSGEGTEGHILIQTSAPDNAASSVEDTSGNDNNILVRALEGIHEQQVKKVGNGSQKNVSVPIGSDGEPIKLPENLESLPRAEHFPTQRHRWNTNEEIAATLISFDRHAEWQSKEVKIRPKSGSMLLYSRKKVRYRRDGYCWKKRKDGKTTREDHMKLKVQGIECIYGCYVHSAILPTFHRRCYWLLQNPDIVLVHYLNVPYPDDNKMAVITPSISLWADKKEWTKEELVSQLKPMFFSEEEPDINNELEISTAETVEAIVSQLMEKQRIARQAALVKQLECGCPDSTCADGKTCSHLARQRQNQRRPPSVQDSNQVSSTTDAGSAAANGHLPRMYSREGRGQQIVHKTTHNTKTGNTPPLVLSLSQIQGGGGLLILNSQHHQNNHQNSLSVANFSVPSRQQKTQQMIPKQEAMDVSCCTRENKSENNLHDVMLNFNHQEVVMTSAPSTPTKHPDVHRDRSQEYDMLGSATSGTQVTKNENHVNMNGFFNETLDLSQEDIQRTLSANMPFSTDRHREKTTSNACQIPQSNVQSGINPMEFINNCDNVDAPTPVVDDDVFVNLDAFDMLGEFPDLEVLESTTHSGILDVNPSELQHQRPQKQQIEQQQQSNVEYSAKISDYSPEWAYPEGGVKVLVTGPWQINRTYSVLFDSFPVPTTLVQSGVLRCYCPAHEAGLATLQVACDGYVISNSVIFEYKLLNREQQSGSSELKTEKPTDNLLKFTLLQRLEAMDDRLQIKQEPSDTYEQVEDSILFKQSNFEDRLVNFCHNRSLRIWRKIEEINVSWCSSYKGMTILHLAAALGYTKLLSAMLRWRAENSSLLLETEIDALSRDEEGNTPLIWACSKGHTDIAVMLYKWNHTALNAKNDRNQTALECAKLNNHLHLIREIEMLEIRREYSPEAISPSESLTSLISNKSHDGVFLRPGAVTRSEMQKFKMLNLDLDDSLSDCNNSFSPLLSDSSSSTRYDGNKLVKRSSIDSGIHMIGTYEKSRSNKTDKSKFFKFDRSLSFPLNNQFDSFMDNGKNKLDSIFCESNDGPRSNSPIIDVEAVSDDEASELQTGAVGDQDARVLTLAEQIIAAIPDRIKNESEDIILDSSPGTPSDGLHKSFLDPLLDQSPCSFGSNDFSFEFSDHNYRYYDMNTPCSSLSPASSSCMQSPSSFILDSPSPPPTTADFCEFFQASGSVFEKDFSNLTLSDREQRELYQAAKIIQKAYRSYKGRQQREQEKERAAAVVIQNYYRRYKQFAWCKQATKAATVIQHGFRSYCENKRFKKNQQETSACIQSYYQDNHQSKDDAPTTGLKRTYSQRRQNQAARKIQQFMRQSKNKLQRERAEKEKLEDR